MRFRFDGYCKTDSKGLFESCDRYLIPACVSGKKDRTSGKWSQMSHSVLSGKKLEVPIVWIARNCSFLDSSYLSQMDALIQYLSNWENRTRNFDFEVCSRSWVKFECPLPCFKIMIASIRMLAARYKKSEDEKRKTNIIVDLYTQRYWSTYSDDKALLYRCAEHDNFQ